MLPARSKLRRSNAVKDKTSRFAKNFVAALGDCAFEEVDLIAPVLLILGVAGSLLFIIIGASVVYELFVDPSSVDVSARLAGLSIDPGHWT